MPLVLAIHAGLPNQHAHLRWHIQGTLGSAPEHRRVKIDLDRTHDASVTPIRISLSPDGGCVIAGRIGDVGEAAFSCERCVVEPYIERDSVPLIGHADVPGIVAREFEALNALYARLGVWTLNRFRNESWPHKFGQ